MLSITKTLRGLFARPATPSRPRPARRPLRLECLEERTLLCNPGELDLTFDGNGKTTLDFTSGDEGRGVGVQTDGKIVITGASGGGFTLARFNTNGSLDSSFDGDGKVVTPISKKSLGTSWAVAIQTDGKIVSAGWAGPNRSNGNDFALVRYKPDGSLDNSFNTTGKVTTHFGSSDDQARAVAMQPDGKIVAVGFYNNAVNTYDLAIARYNSNGTLDNSFSGDGKQITTLGADDQFDSAVVVQPDGKIVVAGWARHGSNNEWFVMRYNPNGSLDSNFDTDGKVTTEFFGNGAQTARAVDLQSDGKIVVAGSAFDGTRSSFALARYNPNGSLDNTFDTDGKLTTDFGASGGARGVRVQSDGRIVAAGSANNVWSVTRYTTDGSLDTSFDMDGKVQTHFGSAIEYAEAVAIGPDGKIVVAGSTFGATNADMALAVYCP